MTVFRASKVQKYSSIDDFICDAAFSTSDELLNNLTFYSFYGYDYDTIFSAFAHLESKEESFREFNYGTYYAIAIGLDADAALTGKYALKEFKKERPAPVAVPYNEDFESNPEGWEYIDADGDGYNWTPLQSTNSLAHSGKGVLTSASYNYGALTPDNWAITVTLSSSENYLSFWVVAQDLNWKSEHYAVYISDEEPDADNLAAFGEPLFEETFSAKAYKQVVIDIPAEYAGKTVYFAFRHFNCTDMFRLNIDDVSVTEEEPEAEEPEEPGDPLQIDYTLGDYAEDLTMEDLTEKNWDIYARPYNFNTYEWAADRDYIGPAIITDIEDEDDEDLLTISGLSYVYGELLGFDDSVTFGLYDGGIYSHVSGNGSFVYNGTPLYVRTEYLDSEFYLYSDYDYVIFGEKVADGIIALLCSDEEYDIDGIGFACYKDAEYSELYSAIWFSRSILLVDSDVYPTPNAVSNAIANAKLNKTAFKAQQMGQKKANFKKSATKFGQKDADKKAGYDCRNSAAKAGVKSNASGARRHNSGIAFYSKLNEVK